MDENKTNLTIRYLLIKLMKALEGWRDRGKEQRKGKNLQEQASSTSELDTIREEEGKEKYREMENRSRKAEVLRLQWKNYTNRTKGCDSGTTLLK